MKKLISLFMLLACLASYAQQTDTTYQSKYGMKCDADTAHFMRITVDQGEQQYITEYFISNQQLRRKGLEIKGIRRNIREGLWETFYENGNPKMKVTYANSNKTGISKEWFENGQQEAIWRHEEGNTTLKSSWSADGKEMTVDGEGIYEDHYTGGEVRYRGPIKAGKQHGEWNAWFVNGQLMHKRYIKDGYTTGKEEIWVSAGPKLYEATHSGQVKRIYWNKEGKEIHRVSTEVNRQSTNWFGFGEVDPLPLNMAKIRKAIGYPRKAQKKDIEGQVIVALILDRQGDIVIATVLKPAEEIFCEAIMKHIYDLQFTPGIVSGKYVKVHVNAPFRFQLTD